MRTFIALDLPREAINEIAKIQKLIWKKTLFTGKLTEKEVDKTVDTALEIGSILDKKYGSFSYGRCRVYPDGTGLVMEK